MPRKKSITDQPTVRQYVGTPSEQAHEQILSMLVSLQQKVFNSPVLNGGFDKMSIKVDNIEDVQGKIGAKVDLIHDAIYHPDSGLFARVKTVESVKPKIDDVDKLEKDVLLLRQWHDDIEDEEEEIDEWTEKNDNLVSSHEEKIKKLDEFQTRLVAVFKWTGFTLAGASVTLIGKLLYDFITNHVAVH